MSFARRLLGILVLASPLALVGCFYDTSGDAAVIPDTDPDASAQDGGCAADAGVGMEEECTKTGGECVCLQASLCLYDATSADANPAGVCTFTGCFGDTAVECYADYTCCDCSSSTLVPETFKTNFCAPDANVTMLSGMAGCTCE
jgi:hypothetical protein